MNCENSVVIAAPLERIFQTTSDLPAWPKILPHYRRIDVLERTGGAMIVRMAARRGCLPIQWTSRYEADTATRELRFQHLTAFTRGMTVTWTFTPTATGVLVRITHELPGTWAAELLARWFIKPVATQTLTHFKRYLEAQP